MNEWVPSSRAPDEIIENRLYLGGVAPVFDSKTLDSLGITHVLSVCEYAFNTQNTLVHNVICIDDDDGAKLLTHLPGACRFIQSGMDAGGKVYVHCVLGISRSVSIVCGYLMKTRALSVVDALEFVQSRRPVAQPNDGFMKQLEIWSACDYAPTVLNPEYAAWKREWSICIPGVGDFIPEARQLAARLYTVEGLPRSAESFFSATSVTHLLTFEPCQSIVVSDSTLRPERCHLDLEKGASGVFVLKLSEAVEFIKRGLEESSESIILVHSFDLTQICLVACAYLMNVRGIRSPAALQQLQIGLPEYSPTPEFISLISLYEACHCVPTSDHP